MAFYIKKGGSLKKITIPTKTSELTNDSNFLIPADIEGKANSSDLSRVAFSGSYTELTNAPSRLSDFVNDLNISSLTPIIDTMIGDGIKTSFSFSHNRGTQFGESYGYPDVTCINSHGEIENFDIIYNTTDKVTIVSGEPLPNGSVYKVIIR